MYTKNNEHVDVASGQNFTGYREPDQKTGANLNGHEKNSSLSYVLAQINAVKKKIFLIQNER